ncbi:MAG: anthranilate phosphoribosyltransferase [Chloroflexi bacterium]|nr:anthranilate phosphoribosyltransferase [Chloroflexota bacterium]
MKDALAKLVAHEDLSDEQAAACMEALMTGEATPAQFGAFVTALRMKGETADEIAGLARVMRAKSSRIEIEGPLLDTCGTGGAALSSFNVSTCAAFIAAGAGARVAKHGNRAMTSQCGSADVLEALGARIDLGPDGVRACIERAGVGFMFAQAFHPAMKYVGPLRREIGIRTVFNLLGPLTNPAGARRQVIGVAQAALVETIARALVALGCERALVVHGDDGCDEISICAPTTVAEVSEGTVRTFRISPEEMGLARHDISYLRGGTPEQNAAELRLVLEGVPGPLRDFALINAGAGLVAWGTEEDLAEAVDAAARSIDSGAALAKLNEFVEATNAVGAPQ